MRWAGIDGHDNTNSREAFARAYDRGFRTFEVDLLWVEDSIVTVHTAADPGDSTNSLTRSVTTGQHVARSRQLPSRRCIWLRSRIGGLLLSVGHGWPTASRPWCSSR